ncbi:MAG: winged helix DNA-binding domain-containing protein [Solirubrobacteraceae bacterium]|nr:winged helix DNA-binding domain-containing protein [Patulibacter sp.]
MMTATRRLTLRELNRATLARQHLLERSTLEPLAMIEHLVGLQAQAPNPPFIGLWTRSAALDFDAVSQLVVDRRAVRILTMRGTVHLLSARDALGLQPHCTPVFDREFKSVRGKALAAHGIDRELVRDRAEALLREQPYSARELSEVIMGEHPDWPEAVREHVAAVPRVSLPLVQIPPRGLWGESGVPTYQLIDDWLGEEVSPMPMEDVVRRYLGAFGPATVRDLQQWCGLTRLKAVVEGIADELEVFEGPGGERLYDLPDAPRPDGDAPAPVRILPEFDNLLVSHADRTRMISDERRKAMSTLNGMVPGTVLVDGVVAALAKTQKVKGVARLRIMPLERLTKATRGEIEIEGRLMLEAMGGPYADAEIGFEDPGERWRPHAD